MDSKKLKIGFLVDNEQIAYHYHQVLCELNNSEKFCKPIIISDACHENLLAKLFNPLQSITNLVIKLIVNLERGKLKRESYFKNSFDIYKTSTLDCKTLKLNSVKSKFNVRKYKNEDIAKIKEQSFDVLIRCGNGILKGEILECSKLGILSFHHGDNREFRGMPSGFWEVYNNTPSTGFIIQKLTENLDKGEVLARGNVMTSSYWQKNNAFVTLKSIACMSNLLNELAHGKKLSIEKNVSYSNLIYKNPNLIQLSFYVLKQIFQFLIKSLKRILGFKIYWEVVVAKNNGFQNLLDSNTLKIKNNGKNYFADPFLINYQGREICFVEEYSHQTKKGIISAVEIHPDSTKYLGKVIEEDFHLSFPYIFKFKENLFMLPETAQKKEIRLYKCIDFPLKWSFEKTLITNIDAADSMIIRLENEWVLFTNVCGSNIGDHCSELHVYFSSDKDPTSSKWVKHNNNPVVFDSLRSRNAGLVLDKGKILRVSQIHGKSTYGKGVNINIIKNITSEKFEEEIILTYTGKNFKNSKGIHHISASNDYIAFDICNEKLSWFRSM